MFDSPLDLVRAITFAFVLHLSDLVKSLMPILCFPYLLNEEREVYGSSRIVQLFKPGTQNLSLKSDPVRFAYCSWMVGKALDCCQSQFLKL